jgi:ketosteroid isomerase-like protein
MRIQITITIGFALLLVIFPEVPAQRVNKDLQDMVESEKSFSATTVKVGFRDSFIQFFADDGIGFGPGPERTKEGLLQTPPSTEPEKIIFKWQPYFCDISLGGDMGYTTGPIIYQYANGTPLPGHGMYFSVWQKQTNGDWKVAIDMGTGTPEAIAPIDTDFTRAKNPNGISQSKTKKLNNGDFDSIDAAFSAEIQKSGLFNGYNNRLSNEFRIHRQGFMPIVGKDTLKKYLDSINGKLSFQQVGGKVSGSNDFAFTYGSFRSNGSESIDGYYIHVWRRDKSGNWKLVVDVSNTLPKK